jgi:hypothetical protein
MNHMILAKDIVFGGKGYLAIKDAINAPARAMCKADRQADGLRQRGC